MFVGWKEVKDVGAGTATVTIDSGRRRVVQWRARSLTDRVWVRRRDGAKGEVNRQKSWGLRRTICSAVKKSEQWSRRRHGHVPWAVTHWEARFYFRIGWGSTHYTTFSRSDGMRRRRMACRTRPDEKGWGVVEYGPGVFLSWRQGQRRQTMPGRVGTRRNRPLRYMVACAWCLIFLLGTGPGTCRLSLT